MQLSDHLLTKKRSISLVSFCGLLSSVLYNNTGFIRVSRLIVSDCTCVVKLPVSAGVCGGSADEA